MGLRRTIKPVPAYLLPKSEPVILARDFDAIPEAEDELRREVMAGHSFSAEIQGRKPKS